MEYALLAVLAAVASLVLTPPVRRLATRLGAIDEPGPRRAHHGRVPRLGGLAVLGAALGALAIDYLLEGNAIGLLSARGASPGHLLAGVAVVTATGAIDDLWGLRVRWKLGLQVLAAGIAVAGGYGLAGVTNPFTGRYVEFDALGGVITLLWIVGITNAINLIDGLDGLAAGVGAIASVALFLVSVVEGRTDAACLWATLAGALAGFLVYNFAPASIFLGDTGSLVVGYLMAILAIQSLEKGATAVVVLAPVAALGLPIIDTVLAVGRRTLASGFTAIVRADSDHVHHRLVEEGMSPRAAVLALWGVCAGCGLLAFVAVVAQGAGKGVVVAAAVVAIWFGVRRLRGGRQ